MVTNLLPSQIITMDSAKITTIQIVVRVRALELDLVQVLDTLVASTMVVSQAGITTAVTPVVIIITEETGF